MTVCSHRFHDCPHPGYVRCVNCGSYKSCVAPPPEEVYTALYWTHERGHSTLAEQVWNCEDKEAHPDGLISKNDFILRLIDVEDRSAALEIGCAPGALLGRLRRDAVFGYVRGIDPCMEWSRDVDENFEGIEVCPSYFPPFDRCEETRYSLVVSCDTFEHSHRPWPFLQECARLLKPNGQLILMLPIIREGYEMPERMWHPTEHVWLHSESNLRALLEQAGFDLVVIDQWCPGHDTVSARFVGAPVNQLRAA